MNGGGDDDNNDEYLFSYNWQHNSTVLYSNLYAIVHFCKYHYIAEVKNTPFKIPQNMPFKKLIFTSLPFSKYATTAYLFWC